jgi:hypothetical protein
MIFGFFDKGKILRVRQKINIFIDEIRYCRDYRVSYNTLELLGRSDLRCAVLCKGTSLLELLEVEDSFDIYILVNFDRSMRKYVKLFDKISEKPVVIFSSIDELILPKFLAKRLQVVGVYLRLVGEDVKNFMDSRIRRRLEIYGQRIRFLDQNFSQEIIDEKLKNTGLSAIYWASYYFSDITIFGLDLYSSPYLNGKEVRSQYVFDRAHSLELFSSMLLERLFFICEMRPEAKFNWHTTYNMKASNNPPNIKIFVIN